jgi:hypothetical protein
MTDQDAARAELTRTVNLLAELLDAHRSAPGHRTSAEWLSACIDRSKAVNRAARACRAQLPGVARN